MFQKLLPIAKDVFQNTDDINAVGEWIPSNQILDGKTGINFNTNITFFPP
jgi:hypothetical protein